MDTKDIIGRFLGGVTIITHYEIKDDMILVYFNGGSEYSIPYTIQNEENLLLVMKLQCENHNLKYINIQYLKQVLFLGMSVMCCTGGIFAFPRCDMVWKVISFLIYLCNARNVEVCSREIANIFKWFDGVQKNYEFLKDKGLICEIDEEQSKIHEEVVLESGMNLSSDIMEEYRDLKLMRQDVSYDDFYLEDKGKVMIKK